MEQTTEAVIDGLARALAEAIRRFYADPKNEAEFQEWLKQKRNPRRAWRQPRVQDDSIAIGSSLFYHRPSSL